MSENALESRLRRKARSQGLTLTRSRCRTPEAPEYGRYFISDSTTQALLTSQFGITLDEADDWLAQEA